MSAIWNRQSTDEAVQAEWIEALAPVSFESALDTVRSIRDLGQTDPPTPGEVYLGARQRDDARPQRLSLEFHEPPPTEEQIEKNKAILRDMIAKLSLKVRAS